MERHMGGRQVHGKKEGVVPSIDGVDTKGKHLARKKSGREGARHHVRV